MRKILIRLRRKDRYLKELVRYIHLNLLRAELVKIVIVAEIINNYLGVTNSCVTRFVASGQKPDVDDLITKL